MTAKTKEGALALEAALGAERLAKIKAEAFRAGLEAAALFADMRAAVSLTESDRHPKGSPEAMTERCAGIEAGHIADAIRSIPVPEKL